VSELEDIKAKLEELKNTLKGLSMEVEGWRQHTGSTGTFILDAIHDAVRAVNKLEKAVSTLKGT
jgi:hypothetical protein